MTVATTHIAFTPVTPRRHIAVNSTRVCITARFACERWAARTTMLSRRCHAAHPEVCATTTNVAAGTPIAPVADLAIGRARPCIARTRLGKRRAWKPTMKWFHRDSACTCCASTTTTKGTCHPICKVVDLAVDGARVRVARLKSDKYRAGAGRAAIGRRNSNCPLAHFLAVTAAR